MAVVTVSGVTTTVAKGVISTRWTFPAAASTGSIGTPISVPHYPDKTITWRGTWATGATILIEGSNTATYSTGASVFFPMNDPGFTALSYSTGKVRTALENPRWIRPKLTARTGTLGTPIIEIISQSPRR